MKLLLVKYFSLALARSSPSKYQTVMAYLQRRDTGLQQAQMIRACAQDRGGTLTWWRKPAEPREGSVYLTRTTADGQIWDLCRQTEPFLRGRFEEGLHDPGKTNKNEKKRERETSCLLKFAFVTNTHITVHTSTRVSHIKGSTEEDNVNEKGCPTELQEESSGSEAAAGRLSCGGIGRITDRKTALAG